MCSVHTWGALLSPGKKKALVLLRRFVFRRWILLSLLIFATRFQRNSAGGAAAAWLTPPVTWVSAPSALEGDFSN